MSTITKIISKRTGKTSYKAVLKRSHKVLKTKTFKLKKDARKWLQVVQADEQLIKSFQQPRARMLFSELKTEYEKNVPTQDKSRPQRLNSWEGHLDGKAISLIDGDMIQGVLDSLTCKDTTKNRYKAALSSVFIYGLKQKYLIKNPCSDVAHNKEDNSRVRYLDDAERKALLSSAKESEYERLYLAIVMAMTTGCRRGELQGIRFSDISWKNRTIFLGKTKNGEKRILTIPLGTMGLLKQFREIGTGYLFPHPDKAGESYDWRWWWDLAKEGAGIKDFRWHDLRHDCASTLAMNGTDLHTIGEVLGHKCLASTARYTHISVEHKQSVTDKVFSETY